MPGKGPNLVTIRKGLPDDIITIKECLIDSWVEHARHEPELLDEDRMRVSKVEEYYQEIFDDPDNHFLFVAEEGGKFAGFIRADIKEIPNFFKHPRILYLDDTYIKLEFRRKGIARQLLHRAEELAKELGIKRIQSRVYSYNKPVQEMLESGGYRVPHATWDKVI